MLIKYLSAAHDTQDSIKITSRRPEYQCPRVPTKTRLSVRNGFLVSGNYLEASTTVSPGVCAVGVGGVLNTTPEPHI